MADAMQRSNIVGQKVNPIGFRIALNKNWSSRWYANKKDFGGLLQEDIKIRNFVKKQLNQAAVSRIDIERFANRIRVTVHSARPGLVFGRKRAEYDSLRDALNKLTDGKDIYIDVVEINEAFASVVLAWQKELDYDLANVNVNGGAMALGHPIGATGTRLMTTLLNEMERSGARYGLQTMCEGGGQANVTILERL